MPRVQVLTGAPWSDREARLDALVSSRLPRVRCVVPSQSYARLRAEQILLQSDTPGLWGEVVVGFTRLAELILLCEGIIADQLDDLGRTIVMQRAMRQVAADPTRCAVLDGIRSEARSDGLVRHLLSVIEGLKQAAVEPGEFRRRVARRSSPTELDALVSEVYDAYQSILIREGLYDRIGLVWEAELVCRQRPPAWLRDVDLLVLDGFDDFTPSGLRLVETLATRVEEMVIGVPCDLMPDRGDLFALQAATVHTLITRLDAQCSSAEEAPAQSTLEFSARYLLNRGEPPALSEGIARNLRVQPCAGGAQQVEWVAQQAKSLLIEGVRPEDIAVVRRDFGSGAATLRACFARAGVPLRMHLPPTLAESGACTLMLTALEATVAWPRDDVADLLSHPWVSFEGAPDVPAAGTLASIAGIRGGLNDWRHALARLTEGVQRDPLPHYLRDYRRLPKIAEQATLMEQRLESLAAEAARLPDCAPMSEMAIAISRFVAGLGLREGLRKSPPDVAEWELAALDALLDMLGRLCDAHAAIDEPVPRMELPTRLRAMMRSQSFSPPAAGGVACMDLERARNLRFDHVFLLDANEGALPRLPSVNAIYSEQDLQDLERMGIDIETNRRRAQRELVLFHRALCMPRKSLTITWRNSGSDRKELRRSPLLIDLLAALPGDVEAGPPRVDSFVPAPALVTSEAELLAAAIHNPSILEWFPETAAPVHRGEEIERRRYSNLAFNAHDGRLEGAAALDRAAERFGPDRTFSAGQIDEYGQCAHRFYAQRVLNLAFVEPPTDELSALDRGSVLHDAMEGLFAALGDTPLNDLDDASLDAAIKAAVDDAVRPIAAVRHGAQRTLLMAEARRLQREIRTYAHQVRGRETEPCWKPVLFEAAFGPAADPGARSSAPAADGLVLRTAIGIVRFTGRIDRVDAWRGDPDKLRVIDYKTGEPPTCTEVRSGGAVQLPVYALAVEQVIRPGSQCVAACYHPIGTSPRVRPDLSREDIENWRSSIEAAKQTVAAALTGIRAGDFAPLPSKPQKCPRCPARILCRYEKARIQRKPGGEALSDEVEPGATEGD